MFGQPVEDVHHLGDARVRERDGALGGAVRLLLALPIDHAAEPEIECDQRRAGDQNADGDRSNILARECARKQTHSGPG